MLRIASILRGARYKENMTQVNLAKKLKITQSDLSQNGTWQTANWKN